MFFFFIGDQAGADTLLNSRIIFNRKTLQNSERYSRNQLIFKDAEMQVTYRTPDHYHTFQFFT